MDRTTIWILIACLLMLTALSACGGGGGGGIAGDLSIYTESLSLESNPNLDGVVDVSGFLAFRPEECFSYTGDLDSSFRPGYRARQLFAFFLGSLPEGARVLRAELRLNQARIEGEPYRKNGDVVVDHVDYVRFPGPDSYDGQTLERLIGVLSTDDTLEVKTVDVTDAVRADLEDDRSWAQFRLRFHRTIHLPILDHVNDYVRFTDAEGGAGGPRPELVIVYQE